MAETKDAHVVVEIPVDEEHQQKLISAMNTISSAIQHHPLMEISQSPGHLLLLKLWQREEDLFGRKIAIKETRLDNIRREIFHLCCFFFIFLGLFLTILFTSYNSDENHNHSVCQRWWIPSLSSVCTSFVIVFLVQMKLFRYWKVTNQLQREKNDNRTLTRCIQELRMKGARFDLSKEPQNGKRMKSSSVEIKWKPLTWFSQFDLPHQQIHPLCLVFLHIQVWHPQEFKDEGPIERKEISKKNQELQGLYSILNAYIQLEVHLLKGMKHCGPKVTEISTCPENLVKLLAPHALINDYMHFIVVVFEVLVLLVLLIWIRNLKMRSQLPWTSSRHSCDSDLQGSIKFSNAQS